MGVLQLREPETSHHDSEFCAVRQRIAQRLRPACLRLASERWQVVELCENGVFIPFRCHNSPRNPKTTPINREKTAWQAPRNCRIFWRRWSAAPTSRRCTPCAMMFSSMAPAGEEGDDFDPLETLEAQEGSKSAQSAADEVSQKQVMASIENEIEKLPARQREAFILRYWEDLDVAETARAMGCSEGSVKTHCSRATHTLAAALKLQGITL